MPLVKDNLGDITASSNYRAIAGGSLLLKLLDIVILQLEGDKLSFDQLQFAYQEKSSTVMCSWTVTAVIEHFNRSGSVVYGAAMDMSKAFDLVEWSQLFLTLVQREVEPILLRLMLFIYRNQRCDVKWCSKYSERFSVSNGARQGAVSSAILFAVYIDELLSMLRKSGFGCHIHGDFLGAMIFADDIMLLSASRSGLQALVDICQEFSSEKNLKFGTDADPSKSKTKCIIFSKKKGDTMGVLPIKLNGDPLPWVGQIKHLGNILQSNNSMTVDILQKRGKFIGKVNSLLQEFHYANSSVLTKLINLYATSFYGSATWDINSRECDKLYKSWNVTIRHVYKLDRRTHRYFIEPISQCLHPRVMLASRYVTFHKSLIKSNKLGVRFLARLNENDNRTLLGRTLGSLAQECCVNDIGSLAPSLVKKMCPYFSVPELEKWRIPIVKELLSIQEGLLSLENITKEEISEMLEHLCTS